MKTLFAIAAGGALGATLRYLVVHLGLRLFGPGFPYGVLAVNVAGSFLMGVIVAALAAGFELSAPLRAFLTVGCLGGFTTFSSFSLDAVTLWERGEGGLALAYVLGSVILSILGLAAGLALVRSLAAP
ncbi:MAG: fluoride efflux transporter CrcB [Alphaproteobacteria bacterium]|nr:fluoride efflux transporter CrcB [Alphaproteobacteria bacterium]